VVEKTTTASRLTVLIKFLIFIFILMIIILLIFIFLKGLKIKIKIVISNRLSKKVIFITFWQINGSFEFCCSFTHIHTLYRNARGITSMHKMSDFK
jgi:hypothetical protein